MRLKIMALFTGLIIVLLCLVSGIKTNTINPLAFFQTATAKGGFRNATLLTSTPSLTPTPTPPAQTATPIPSPTATPSPTPAALVIYAAGDIAECFGRAPDQNNGAMITSNMLLETSGPIFTLGDDSNDDGSKTNYAKCYNPTWGRLLSRTYPVMGNHDRGPDIQGSAYFAYFAGRTGVWGHYSLDMGSWHIVVLNAECGVGGQDCSSGSAQEKWLKADLAANRQKCIMALWHQPLFTSGKEPPFLTGKSFWTDLYAAKADIILNGHNHLYERFLPMDPKGAITADGLREFVVGTGGADLQPAIQPPLVSEVVRDVSTFGYLKLTLLEDSYEWQFVAQPGQAFTDSGEANCHH